MAWNQRPKAVEGSNVSAHDEKYGDPHLRKGTPLQKIFLKVDVATLYSGAREGIIFKAWCFSNSFEIVCWSLCSHLFEALPGGGGVCDTLDLIPFTAWLSFQFSVYLPSGSLYQELAMQTRDVGFGLEYSKLKLFSSNNKTGWMPISFSFKN